MSTCPASLRFRLHSSSLFTHTPTHANEFRLLCACSHPDFIGSTQGGLLSRPFSETSGEESLFDYSANASRDFGSSSTSASSSSSSSSSSSHGAGGFFRRLFGSVSGSTSASEQERGGHRGSQRIELNRPPAALVVDKHLKVLTSREQIQINLLSRFRFSVGSLWVSMFSVLCSARL
jgi:hypothetical protein